MRLLALLTFAVLTLAQDSQSNSDESSVTNRPTASEPRTTVFTTTFRSVIETTLSNGDVSERTTSGVATITSVIGGGDEDGSPTSSSRSTSTTPKPTAPTDLLNGGGGVNGAPLPGQTGVRGAYGPDDNYIAGASKITLSASLAGVAAAAALVLL